MELEIFQDLDPARKELVSQSIQNIIDRQQQSIVPKFDMSNSPYVNRRDAKLLSKKHQAVSMYF